MEKTDNEIIADFMGLKSFEDSRYGTLWPSPLKAKTPATCFGLCYHESWDWLMPVVEKIEEALLQVTIATAYTNICGELKGVKYNQDTCFEHQEDTKLSVTHLAVLKAIDFINSQSPNKQLKV